MIGRGFRCDLCESITVEAIPIISIFPREVPPGWVTVRSEGGPAKPTTVRHYCSWRCVQTAANRMDAS